MIKKMELTKFLEKTTQTEFARRLNVSQGLVHQWVTKKTPISPQRAVEIELATKGDVSRKDLRPNDWHLIWPELLE